MRKGQAGLDFLMTYGWALLLIVLVVGALFALGVFDTSNFTGNTASGFPQLGVVGWRLEPNGALSMKFRNQVGFAVNVTSVNATFDTQMINTTLNISLGAGMESGTLNIGNFSSLPVGSSYKLKIDLTYIDLSSNFTYINSGTLIGKVK